MQINFELFKVFYTVANEKSISKGAQKLMISQPAVTQSIKTLEDELGGKLFIRTPKGVVLTDEGKNLYEYVEEGMNYFINGTNKFMSMKNIESGTLNIGATTVVSENFLIPYIKEYHKLYPNINIKIVNDLTDNLLKELRNGNLDIVITAIPSYEIKDLNIHSICDLHDIFVSSKEYKDFKTIKDILKESIMIQKRPSVTRNNFDKYLADHNLKCNISMEVISHSLLVSLAESELGIALVTKEFVKDKLNKTLFEMKTKNNLPIRKLGYMLKNNTYPSFTTNKFIELLTKDCK